MRFYLNFPLIVGYALMATSACLGMLQLAAARGGYAGLSLFTADQKHGKRIGISLTISALLAYVLFAPEILTPGLAGAEVAEMFALCALVALVITLVGAKGRIQREHQAGHLPNGGELFALGELPATLYRSSDTCPVVVLLPDPTGFVIAPGTLIHALTQAGLAVLSLDAQGLASSDAPLSRRTLLGHLSTAVVQLGQQTGIDRERVGLLGLGLGGDAVWQAASADSQIKAALAVSPIGPIGTADSETPIPGLQWLRELSYRQTWRWRRNKSALRQAVLNLQSPDSKQAPLVDTLALLCSDDTILAMRNQREEVKLLPVSSWRHFTLLKDRHAIKQAVAWLQGRLLDNE